MIEGALLGGAIVLGQAVNATLQSRQTNANIAMKAIDSYNTDEGVLSDNSEMLGNSSESERQNRNLIPDALALSNDIYCINDKSIKAYHTKSFYESNINGWVWVNDYFEYPNAFPNIRNNKNLHNFLLCVRDTQGTKYIDKQTGLVSGVFFQYVNEKLIRIAYVTKGTTPTKREDWGANFKQGWDGNSALYQKSLKNAIFINKMINHYINDSGYLYFFGHSLGGGLANYNAMNTKRPSVTFNAASVHPDSVIRNLKNYKELVENKSMIGVYVEGEVLSLEMSNKVGLPKNGNRYKIEVNPDYFTNGDNMIERHFLQPLCSQYGLVKMNWKDRIFIEI